MNLLLTAMILPIAGVVFYFGSAIVAGLYEAIKEYRDKNKER